MHTTFAGYARALAWHHQLALSIPCEAGAAQHRARLVDARLVTLDIRAGPSLKRRSDWSATRNHTGAGEDDIEDLLAIRRMLQGLAEGHVVARRHREVEPHLVLAMRRCSHDLEVWVLANSGAKRHVQIPRQHVGVTALEHTHHALHLRNNGGDKAVELRRHEEILVGRELDVLALAPLHELPRTGTDGLVVRPVGGCGQVGGYVFPDMLGCQEGVAENVGNERGRRLLELQTNRVVSNNRRALERIRDPAHGRELMLENKIEGELHVLHGRWFAVMELGVWLKDDVDRGLVDDVPRLQRPGHNLRLFVASDEGRIDQAQCCGVIDFWSLERIERGDVINAREPQDLARRQGLDIHVRDRHVGKSYAVPEDWLHALEALLVVGMNNIAMIKDQRRRILDDALLRAPHETLTFRQIHRLALIVGQLVEALVLVEPEVETSLDGPARMEHLGNEVVGVEPVGCTSP